MMKMTTRMTGSIRPSGWVGLALLCTMAGGSLVLSAADDDRLLRINYAPEAAIQWLEENKGAKITSENAQMALRDVLEAGSAKTLEALLGDPRFSFEEELKATALFWALRNTGKDPQAVVKALLDHGRIRTSLVDPSAGGTALHLAIEKGYQDVAERLIAHDQGPDLNAKDSAEHTALMYAVQKGYAPLVTMLLDRRVEVNEGQVFQIARSSPRILLSLLDHPWVKVNIKLPSGLTLLRWLVGHGETQAIKHLFGRGQIDWKFQLGDYADDYEAFLEERECHDPEIHELFATHYTKPGSEAPSSTNFGACMGSCLLRGCAYFLGGLAWVVALCYLLYMGVDQPEEAEPLLGPDSQIPPEGQDVEVMPPES